MTTRTIRNGATITVPVETGETLKIVAVTGTYTATIVRGTGIGTALATAATGGSYGPYAYAIVVSIAASASSEIDFDVAVTPDVASDTVPSLSFDTSGNVTGLGGPVGASGINANLLVGKSSQTDAGTSIGRCTSVRTPGLVRGLLNTLRTNIVAAGDTVSNAQLDALGDPLDRLMRSSVFAKLKVLWVPVGTNATTGAMVPLIGANFAGINLVSGDYDDAVGITGNGTNKGIDTNWNPTSAGVTATDWGYGAFTNSTTANGILVGDAGGVTTFVGFASSGAYINNVNAGAAPSVRGFNGVQISGGNVTAWAGGFRQTDTAGGPGTLLNRNINILKVNTTYSNQSVCGFAAWSTGLTDDDAHEMDLFFRCVNAALYRPVWQPTLVACGDSNTVGNGSGVTSSNRFSKLLATSLGLTEDNQGSNGTTMAANDALGTSSGRWVSIYKINRTYARAGTLYTVMLGTNDAQCGVSAADFATDYETWLNYQFSAGIDPSQVILLTPPAATNALTDQAVLSANVATVKRLAAKYGTGLVDGYAVTLGQASYFQSDLLHLNVAGHAALSAAVLAYIQTTKSQTTLRRVGGVY